ncbi:MAG: HAD family hydrolase [Bulleidia sp.]
MKLLAADLDGTLLNDQKELPEGMNQALRRLKEKQIAFAACTGRQITNAIHALKEVAEDYYLIAENGSIITHGEEVLKQVTMSQADIKRIVSFVHTMPNAACMLSGSKSFYADAWGMSYLNQLPYAKYFLIQKVDDLFSVEDPIFKITLCDLDDPIHDAATIMKPLQEDYEVSPSGDSWIDINVKGVNKGEGIRFLQQHLGISASETIVIGDSGNDVPMFSEGYAYAMKNAAPAVQSQADEVTELDNNHAGVLQIIHTLTEEL